MDYATLSTTEQRTAAIMTAVSGDELDAMWSAWEERGMSRSGLLYAQVLRRKRGLGIPLGPEDTTRLHEADEAIQRAKDLPPIIGNINYGG